MSKIELVDYSNMSTNNIRPVIDAASRASGSYDATTVFSYLVAVVVTLAHHVDIPPRKVREAVNLAIETIKQLSRAPGGES